MVEEEGLLVRGTMRWENMEKNKTCTRGQNEWSEVCVQYTNMSCFPRIRGLPVQGFRSESVESIKSGIPLYIKSHGTIFGKMGVWSFP